MKSGIAVAGTVLLDKINVVGAYPAAGELTKIINVGQAVGGLVPNVGADLKVMDKNLPVYAVGKVGADGDGDFILSELALRGVDVKGVIRGNGHTSFTDVISVSGGERTFFTYAGECASFGADDINFDELNVKMLHLGYFLLLDKIDGGDGEVILKKAVEHGIKTSIDLVSENSDRYINVLPCLNYTDNLIINEVEAGKLAGIAPDKQNLKKICERLFALGVKERVIIHMPDRGVCLSVRGYTEVPSLSLPEGFVKGSTGAGDAFCAGALLGIYKDFSDFEILEFASQAAAVSLSEADAVSGMKSEADIKEFCKSFSRKSL